MPSLEKRTNPMPPLEKQTNPMPSLEKRAASLAHATQSSKIISTQRPRATDNNERPPSSGFLKGSSSTSQGNTKTPAHPPSSENHGCSAMFVLGVKKLKPGNVLPPYWVVAYGENLRSSDGSRGCRVLNASALDTWCMGKVGPSREHPAPIHNRIYERSPSLGKLPGRRASCIKRQLAAPSQPRPTTIPACVSSLQKCVDGTPNGSYQGRFPKHISLPSNMVFKKIGLMQLSVRCQGIWDCHGHTQTHATTYTHTHGYVKTQATLTHTHICCRNGHLLYLHWGIVLHWKRPKKRNYNKTYIYS